jgi:hypothetical protein
MEPVTSWETVTCRGNLALLAARQRADHAVAAVELLLQHDSPVACHAMLGVIHLATLQQSHQHKVEMGS